MATIRERVRKRDGKVSYHVQVRISGFPNRTETFATRRDAERWAKTVEAEMIEGRHFRNAEARRRTIGQAIDRYINSELPKKRDSSPTWLNWWRDEIGKVKLAHVTPALLVEKRDKLASSKYRRAKPGAKRSKVEEGKVREYTRSPKTVNKYLRKLSHVFTVARKEWHWLSHNPIEGVAHLPEGHGRVRYLSDGERRALLAETAKDPTLHLFVLLALTTAARAGELQKLEWRDIDLNVGRVLFRETKNAQPRAAWISGEVLNRLEWRAKVRRIDGVRVFETVRELRNGTRKLYTYRYRDGFEAAVEAAGIEDFTFHDLRHSAATYLAQAGATEQQLRAIGGWKSNVVSRYVHLAAEDARPVLEQLTDRVSSD